MNIHSTKLWENPKIVLTILSKISKLDLTVIFGNPKIYVLKNKNKIVSFSVIKKRHGYKELKAVYTYPEFRKMGYMLKLLRYISKRHKGLYLFCNSNLECFYKKINFIKVDKKPTALAWRCTLYNTIINLFSKKELIVMKQ
ncbi:hypothetical protein EXS72_00555 [Candidatus Pacearchaeota archaeon]|nr:hypothetical protein [Candidatus Pacearchaeota archaeon]